MDDSWSCDAAEWRGAEPTGRAAGRPCACHRAPWVPAADGAARRVFAAAAEAVDVAAVAGVGVEGWEGSGRHVARVADAQFALLELKALVESSQKLRCCLCCCCCCC